MPKLLEMTQISSDAFKRWQKCRKRFYYQYVRGLQWPSDQSNFKLGRDVHKLLDYQARGLDCALLLAHAPENVRVSFEKLLAHPLTQLPVVANEWAFHVPVSLPTGRTQWLTGRIDRIVRDGQLVRIIDWKTGTGVPKQPAEDWQTMLYTYAVLETAGSPSAQDLGLAGLQPEQIVFTYVEVKADPQTPVRLVEVPYGAQRHAEVGGLLQSVLAGMAAEEEYALPQTCPDRFCQYRPICGIDA